MLTLPKHNRYDYSVIDERPDYSWPGGKRLAVCVTTNIEVYAYRKGTGWDPAKKGEPQQQRNYAWRDYGNRVGIWRLFDLFEDLKIPAAHNINSLLYEYHPEICDRIRKRGDEVVGHGRTNAERQGDLWELDERRLIDDVTQEFVRREGRPPKGWMGPAASESNVTPDLLKEAGYRYVMDWPADDQPFWLKTRAGPLLSVPYPAELNDSAAIIHRDGTARDFADMIVDGFDEMVEQCEKAAAGDDHFAASLRDGPAVPPAAAAQGAQALRRAPQAQTGVVDHAGRDLRRVLRAAAGDDSGRRSEWVTRRQGPERVPRSSSDLLYRPDFARNFLCDASHSRARFLVRSSPHVRAFERTTTMNRSTFTFLTACVTGLVLSCSAQAQMVSRNQIIDALTTPQVSLGKLGLSRSLTLDTDSSGSSSGYVVANDQTKPAVDLHDIYFEFDSATISPAAMPQLRELGAALADPRLAGASFTIGGHTDATGSDTYNSRLSERRAEAVRRFLAENYMIPSTNLHAVGYGKHQPKNKADVFAAENRRVEIVNETPRAQAAVR